MSEKVLIHTQPRVGKAWKSRLEISSSQMPKMLAVFWFQRLACKSLTRLNF